MEILEVGEILGMYRLLPKPQNVIIVGERVSEGPQYYRGLAPSGRSDVIVLTTDGNSETVLHEDLHTMGFDELGAGLLAKILIRKAQILQSIPFFKSFIEQPVKYQKCSGCQEFEALHTKYQGRASHYVRV